MPTVTCVVVIYVKLKISLSYANVFPVIAFHSFISVSAQHCTTHVIQTNLPKIESKLFSYTVKSQIESATLFKIQHFWRDSNRVRTLFEWGLYFFA